MSEPCVRLTDIRKRYGSSRAVDGISLAVAAGERVVVLGPSGCGKTSMLRIVAGLDVPDEGEVWIDGRQAAAHGRMFVPPYKRGIGLVFQDLALWPHLTVAQSLDFVLESAGFALGDRVESKRSALALVRAENLAGRYPNELSGGEQQRAALARAIVARPKLLLLDEPFSSLDPELRNDMRRDLTALQRALHVTFIAVTHDRADADALADRIVRMRSGRIEKMV